MKIYTKTGDKGTTALLGGARVSKSNERIEAYGTTDELNSHLGLLRDLSSDEHLREMLYNIQEWMFTTGSVLASDPSKDNIKIPKPQESWISTLENEIDKMNETLPELKNFILPGGHPAVSQAHISRCVCRRAERAVVRLNHLEEVPDIIVIFLNRLSDYLFVVARKIAFDLNVQEIPWRS